ncbi:MAG: phenylalanine--tRNA ligase subunit beta [Candidatus Eisenbacteria bacterium]|nr:phenylalanine--tRNA ligase subunit beta [Candidatus Eisenbacteria bacterium]
MQVSLKWLGDYVDFEIDGAELARVLTESLTETDYLGAPGAGVTGVVAARVVTSEKHPDADALKVCVVDWGEGSSTVVCGAPNVRAGMTSVLALPDAKLAGGMKVSERRIRGRLSQGMLVSAAELGLEEASEGIIDLGDVDVGSDVRDLLGLDDEVIELDVQPNRPDCMGVLGVAREVAAALSADFRVPDFEVRESGSPAVEAAAAELADPEGCPRYIARLVTGLTFGPSPPWLARRLRGAGVRSLGNIVDVTNFVMLEYGHPIHAFDYARLPEKRIVVRKARRGETLTTLDGEERVLSDADLLICAGDSPVALAGIMGGGETEVTPATRDVLLECAWFDPVTIRRTARKLAMRTEASLRFERGIDASAMGDVAGRACALMAELAGGRVAPGAIDEGRKDRGEVTVGLREDRVRAMLTDELSRDDMVLYLDRLGFDVRPGGDGSLDVTVPPHRHDVETEADLIEEVARLHGYDRIEAIVPYHPLETTGDPARRMRSRVRDAMVGLGLHEVLTSSFVTPETAEAAGGDPVLVRNPVNKDTPYLRTSLLPGVFDVIRRNRNVGVRDVRIFEIGKVFGRSENGQHREDWRLSGAICGLRGRPVWDTAPDEIDYYDGKGVVWGLLEALEVDSPETSCYDCPFLSSDAGAGLGLSGRPVGAFGMVSRETRRLWGFDFPVFAFELDLDELAVRCDKEREFEPLPRYPKVRRDLAIVVPEDTEAGSVLRSIEDAGEDLLADVQVFDVYRGEQLGREKKSLAFALTYMSKDRTLTDNEVDDVNARIVDRLLREFGATLRE